MKITLAVHKRRDNLPFLKIVVNFDEIHGGSDARREGPENTLASLGEVSANRIAGRAGGA